MPQQQPKGRRKKKEGDDLIPKTSFAPLAYKSKLYACQVRDVEIIKQRPRLVAADLMRIFLASRTPVTLWGPVGARKTRTIEALSQEVDEAGTPYMVQTIQPSTEDPTTIYGLLFTEKDHTDGVTSTQRAIPQVAKAVLDYFEIYDGLTVQFLDEMTTCMPAVQNALLGLLTHGKYGDAGDISLYTSHIMAANPQGTVEVAYDLSSAIINRGGHIAWYGDVDLFFDDWSQGFGLEALKPREDTVWFAHTLVEQGREYVFRDQYRDGAAPLWTPDTLVPYSQMQFSERALTETMKLVERINTIFDTEPDELRQHFVVEIVRAMVGPWWAKKAEIVCALERERLTPRKPIESVRSMKVSMDDTNEQLFNKVGETMHKKSGRPLTPEQEETMLTMLKDEVVKDNIFSQTAYIAAWAFMCTAPTENLYPLYISNMLELLSLALQQQKNDGVQWKAVPDFLPEVLRKLLVSAIKNSRDTVSQPPHMTNMGGGNINMSTLSSRHEGEAAETLDTDFMDNEINQAE